MLKYNKRKTLIIFFVIGAILVLVGASYAFITQVISGQKQVIVNAGVLDLIFDEGNELTLTGELPMYDEVGMIKEPFTFSLTNNSPIEVNYKLKLVNVTPDVIVTDRKCSELGEITINSPESCRKVEYPSELRAEALSLCKNWYSGISTEQECVNAMKDEGAPYSSFEDFIDEGIIFGNFQDTRILVEIYPDNYIEGKKIDVGLLKYGLTKDGVSKVDYLLNMDSTVRDDVLRMCQSWYSGVVTEEDCFNAVKEDGAPVNNFEEFVILLIQENTMSTIAEELVIDEGTIAGGQTINYDYRTWIDYTIIYNDVISGRTFKFKFDVEVSQPLVEPENQECFTYNVNDYIVKDYKTCIDYVVEKDIASDYMAPFICQGITEGTYDIDTRYPDEFQEMVTNGIIAHEEGITITGYTCTNDVVNIPQEFLVATDGLNQMATSKEYIPVVAIGNRAFGELYISNSAEGKEYNAQFMKMTEISSISSVSIPNSVTSIGEAAFSNSGLQSVKLSNNLQILGNFAFYNNNLTNLILPETLIVIDYSAFYNNNLTNVTIPSNVYSIGRSVFEGNNNLTKIVNKPGKVFDWSAILFFDSVEPFAYGTITNYDGTQTVTITSE